jgi:hypothetical protein
MNVFTDPELGSAVLKALAHLNQYYKWMVSTLMMMMITPPPTLIRDDLDPATR